MPLFPRLHRLAAGLMIAASIHGAGYAFELEMPAEGTIVKEVRIEGAQHLAPEEIAKVLALREGKPFAEADYRRDLQSLTNLKSINAVATRIVWENVDGKGLVFTVKVVENPVVNSISVVGNSVYKRDQLLAQLDFKEGDVLPTGARAATSRNLRKFYQGGGHKSAKVTVTTPEASGQENAVDVVVTIDEGVRIKIRHVEFTGNNHFSDFGLTNKITNGRGLLFFSNYLDEQLLEDDTLIILQAYRDAGFLDATVRQEPPRYDEENTAVTLGFAIEEGPRYSVRDVKFEGFTYFTQAELKIPAEELIGRFFDGKKIQKSIDRVAELYGNQGYIDTEVGYRIDRDRAAGTVDLTFTAKESPAIYVGQIVLSAEHYPADVEINALDEMLQDFVPPTRPETVQKEVRLKTGQKYRTADEVRTKERLRNLGIFRKVDIARIPTSDPTVRDIAIKTEDDPAGAFAGVTAGVGDGIGPYVTFQLENPNVGGRADRFRASATFGTRSLAFRIGYFDRYIGDSDKSLDTNLYYTKDKYRALDERRIGASTEVGKPYSERLTGYLRFRLDRVDYSNIDGDPREDLDTYYVAAVRPYALYDARDNIAWPTRGYSVGGGIETGFADGFLFKMLHEFGTYYRLGKSDWIYAYEHTVGLMPFDADEVGLGERFFIGGSNLRGFRYRESGPRDPDERKLAIGGSTRLTQRHELRYTFTERIRGRVFTDAAILEEGPFELGGPRIGSGVGVIMDLGPITVEFDLAIPVVKKSGDKPQYFYIRLGSDF